MTAFNSNFFEILVLHHDGHAEDTGSREHIQECSFQSDLPAGGIGQRAASRDRLIPNAHTLRFLQLHVSDGAEEALEKLSACGQVKTLERIRKQLEVHVLDRQARGRKGARAGHIRNRRNLCLPRGVWGSILNCSIALRSNQETIRTGP